MQPNATHLGTKLKLQEGNIFMPDNYDDLIAQTGQEQEPQAVAEPQSQLSKEEFAAKMKEQRESLSELANQTEMSVTADGGAFQSYLNTLARFERYSAQNTLLIHAQRPDATCLGDYLSDSGFVGLP
jgi:hypothetical protein